LIAQKRYKIEKEAKQNKLKEEKLILEQKQIRALNSSRGKAFVAFEALRNECNVDSSVRLEAEMYSLAEIKKYGTTAFKSIQKKIAKLQLERRTNIRTYTKKCDQFNITLLTQFIDG